MPAPSFSRAAVCLALLVLGLWACRAPDAAPPSLPVTAVTLPEVPWPKAALPPRLERLMDELERRRVEHRVPGLAIALVQGDRVILSSGLGYADLEHSAPAGPETIFAIGSVTKGFTAALVAQLVDEGRVAWDDPLSRYLPYFTPAIASDDPEAELTLADALSHRSGFTRMSLAWASGGASREEVLRTCARAEPWDRFRGAFHYNNVMVLAAGEAAGVAALTSWDELIRERLLGPLGMSSTTLSVADAERDARFATGYAWDEERGEQRELTPRRLDSIAPAGALNSNAADMAQWLRLLLGRGTIGGKRLISAERFDELWAPQVAVGDGIAYGLGWFLQELDGRRVIQHGGNIDGFAAQVGLYPEEDLGFVLLCNVSATPLQALSLGLVADCLLAPEDAPPDPEPGAGTVAAAEGFDTFVGSYQADFGVLRDTTLTVLVNDKGELALDVPGQMVYALKPPDEDGKRFFAMTDAIAVSFHEIAEERAQILRLHQGGLVFEAPRAGYVYPIEVPLAELEPLLGRYAWPDHEEALEVRIQNNHLAVDIPGQMTVELLPPDAAGIRKARVAERISFEFPRVDGRVLSMVFRDADYEKSCPRLDPPAPLLSLEELHALRRTAELDERFEALSGWELSYRAWAAQSGVEGAQTIRLAGWERSEQALDFGRYGWMRLVLTGGGGFEESSFDIGGELTGKRLRQVLHGHPGVYFADWRRVFDQEELVRRSQVGEREALELRLVDGDLPPARVDVDAETGDVLRWREATLVPGLGEISTTTTLSEFREVEGLRIPGRIVIENAENGRLVLELSSAAARAEFAPEVFERPAQ